MITPIGIEPVKREYSPAAIKEHFEQHVKQFLVSRMAEQRRIIGRQDWGEVKMDLYNDGSVMIFYRATCQIRLNSGEGVRENTQHLYGSIEIVPRPAIGTSRLDGPSAPTKLQD